jgi:hypothetical protein
MGDRSSAVGDETKYKLEGRVVNWSGRINEDLEEFYIWNIWNEGQKEDKKI